MIYTEDGTITYRFWYQFSGQAGAGVSMSDSINTGGGGSTGGDARAGKDFIGRDHVTNNYLDRLDTDEIVKELYGALVGFPLHGREGVISKIDRIDKRLYGVMEEQKTAAEIRIGLEQRIAQLSWRFNALLVVSGIEGVAIIYLLLRVLSTT